MIIPGMVDVFCNASFHSMFLSYFCCFVSFFIAIFAFQWSVFNWISVVMQQVAIAAADQMQIQCFLQLYTQSNLQFVWPILWRDKSLKLWKWSSIVCMISIKCVCVCVCTRRVRYNKHAIWIETHNLLLPRWIQFSLHHWDSRRT